MNSQDAPFFQLVYGDRSRLVQVITNFLSNSIKFSNRNSKIIIELEILQKQVLKSSDFDVNLSQFSFKDDMDILPEFGNLRNELEVCSQKSQTETAYINFKLDIKDFGAGIPADKLDKLFVNFGNLAEHQKINQAGRGLGLSICKSIVE